jgi:hypothetical protein
MAFVKLFSTITESSLWSESKETRLLFVTMLAKADPTGFVEAALPGLARVSNLSIDETAESVKRLEGPDRHSKNPANEGRRIVHVPERGGWQIINYEVYRERRNDEERQAYMRSYMKQYRARSVNSRKQMLDNVNHGKPPLAHAEAEEEEDAEGEGGRKPPPPPGIEDDPTSPRIRMEPPRRTMGDFQAMHPRIFIGHGERDAWEATLALWQWDPCHLGYEALVKELPDRKHRVLLSLLTAWLDRHYTLTDEEKSRARC